MVWMIDDELNASLGRRPDVGSARAGHAGSGAMKFAAGVTCAIFAAFAMALYLQPSAPFGGAPYALAPIEPAPPSPGPIAAAADEYALGGTLSEIGQRGLFFLDDAGARQSLVPTLAPKLATPYAVVDVRIDARDMPQAIEAALAQLEARAREKSAAIGFVEAAPAALERIARYVRDLEARGVALTPVTAIVAQPAMGGAPKSTNAGGK